MCSQLKKSRKGSAGRCKNAGNTAGILARRCNQHPRSAQPWMPQPRSGVCGKRALTCQGLLEAALHYGLQCIPIQVLWWDVVAQEGGQGHLGGKICVGIEDRQVWGTISSTDKATPAASKQPLKFRSGLTTGCTSRCLPPTLLWKDNAPFSQELPELVIRYLRLHGACKHVHEHPV